ncbi:MAG: carbon-nitrogen hydrolase family protein [Candidatus Eremiobacteraeota bacterium]|nr:carbon-nitrogen hydrolase family protein [Candidatus Eremiobacteraeota bacterium]MCW5868113.1 carbon-nitrogen hydrolase family protein [Candidatus Eremiobacteraeota bacterium]
MRVGVVQLSSTLETERNLSVAAGLIENAGRSGARLVVLPEVFNRRGESARVREQAEELEGASLGWAAEQARAQRLWLVAGSIAEQAGTACHNTSCLFSPEGERVAVYRKIHLFDVDIPGAVAKESAHVTAGGELVVSQVEGCPVGLTVCYDLRFPELYRRLTLLGARMITVPSAFTERTGRDHWEVLLRARAIENQVFVLAPNQFGTTAGTPTSYGRSMIIDPWGTVLAQAGDGESLILADLDFARQAEVRSRLPSLQHRRPDLYAWPDPIAEG